VESALVSHPAVAEAAVVGFPHEIKGEAIHAFVVLKEGQSAEPQTLKDHVSRELSPIAKPDRLQFAKALPKTRSGKIMRRILRKIAEGKPDEVGDTSTLADPTVVDDLMKSKA
jgi:acetyl-CoA synthetase